MGLTLQQLLNTVQQLKEYIDNNVGHVDIDNDILNNLSEDENGNILYKGEFINQPQINVLTEQNSLLREEIIELNKLLDIINREQ